MSKGGAVLFDKTRHVDLIGREWSESLAREVIVDIYEKTLRSFNSETFWPTHPDEDCKNPSNKSLYFGATGTLLGLLKISKFFNEDLPFESSQLIESIYQSYLKDPDTESVVPSYFLGDTGILLTHYKITKSSSTQTTTTKVKKLSEKERVEELARMLSGSKITKQTLAHASELLVN